jgi:formate dehydrogenase
MRTYDLEDKVVGTVGAGRIGFRVLQRLLPFQCKELVYFDYQSLAPGKLMKAYEVIPIMTYVNQNFLNIMNRKRTGSWSQENRIF